jgi:hypothetical protein
VLAITGAIEAAGLELETALNTSALASLEPAAGGEQLPSLRLHKHDQLET